MRMHYEYDKASCMQQDCCLACIGKMPFQDVTKLKQLLILTAHSRMKQRTKIAMKGKRRRVFSLTSRLLMRFCP